MQPELEERPVAQPTRKALLGVATEIFLADGFKAARVADIARQAGVRLSAINYHFGSKEGLYLAVLQHHADLAWRNAPLPTFDPDTPLQQRLQAFISGMVRRMLDPDSPSRIASLMIRETVNPTAALDVMFERFTLPQWHILFGLLREFFGPQVPREVLVRAALSIAGQGMVYVVARPIINKLQPGFDCRGAALTALAEHIATFCWAGLQAIAAQQGGSHA